MQQLANAVFSCAMRLPRLNLLRVGAGALFLGVAGAVVALALLLNGPTGQIGGSPTSPDASAFPVGNSMASLDERVAFWEARVAANATDYSSTIALIDAYLDRVRSTGDLSDLERAEDALDRARSLGPVGDVRLLLRAGQVAFTMHEFDAARDAATEALDRDPGNETAVALLGDSSLELGDETAALEAYQELEPLAATAPVLTRLARYDLLTGDDEAAEQKMRAAIAASEVEGFAEQIASYRYQLAELLRGEGTPDGRILYHAGLIAAALGRDGEALDLLTQAAEHRSALPPLQVPALEAAIDALGG